MKYITEEVECPLLGFFFLITFFALWKISQVLYICPNGLASSEYIFFLKCTLLYGAKQTYGFWKEEKYNKKYSLSQTKMFKYLLYESCVDFK